MFNIVLDPIELELLCLPELGPEACHPFFTEAEEEAINNAFAEAVVAWKAVILTNLTVRIEPRVITMDGPDETLAEATFTALNSKGFPMEGYMNFDRDDVRIRLHNGTFSNTVKHEMGHVLGFGTLWGEKELLCLDDKINPFLLDPRPCKCMRR